MTHGTKSTADSAPQLGAAHAEVCPSFIPESPVALDGQCIGPSEQWQDQSWISASPGSGMR